MVSGFVANRNDSPSRVRHVHVTGHVYVADPPPFLVGDRRFTKHDRAPVGADSPHYHVAYGDLDVPGRWGTKGWTSLDDPIKPGRGTGSGRQFSSMAPPMDPPVYGSTLQPLTATFPNELRLQELLELQRRKLFTGPAPGAYEVPEWQPRRTTFRRPSVPYLDGPFPLQSELSAAMGITETTRSREISETLRASGDSGIGPGTYEAPVSKDCSSRLRVAPAATIGTGSREGRTPHAKSLSVSRSIQHGIDWHTPVIVQAKPRPPAPGPSGGGDPLPTRSRSAGDPSQTSPRYMQAQPLRPASVGPPPPPPSPVARSVRRPVSHTPGSWSWDTLGHNFRNSWSTLHGGAYTHGDKGHLRRQLGSVGPDPSSVQPGLSKAASADPAMPLATMSPIAEEPSMVDGHLSRTITAHSGSGVWASGLPPLPSETYATPLHSTPLNGTSAGSMPSSAPGTAASAGQGMSWQAHGADSAQSQRGPQDGPSADVQPGAGLLGHGGTAGMGRWPLPPRSAVLAEQLPTAQDLERHHQAAQAAAQAAALSARRQDWQSRSTTADVPFASSSPARRITTGPDGISPWAQ